MKNATNIEPTLQEQKIVQLDVSGRALLNETY